MKSKHAGWIVAVVLLVVVAVPAGILVGQRMRGTARSQAVAGAPAPASEQPVSEDHVPSPLCGGEPSPTVSFQSEVQACSRSLDSLQSRMLVLAKLIPEPPPNAVDGEGGEFEECFVMPYYWLEQAHGHLEALAGASDTPQGRGRLAKARAAFESAREGVLSVEKRLRQAGRLGGG